LKIDDGSLLVRLAHPDKVLAANFSPNGLHIVTSCKDKIARVWNTRSHELELQLVGHKGPIMWSAFSPDGLLIVTASKDGTALRWNAKDGRRIGGALEHGKWWVTFASISPDNKLVVTAASDHKARIFEIETSRHILPDLSHGAPVKSAVFSPDGRFILTGALDYTARIWRTEDHQLLTPNGILRHSGRVMQAAFFSNMERIITVCDDGTIRVWNLAGGLVLPPPGNYSLDGNRFLLCTNDVVQVLETRSGQKVNQWTNSNPVLNNFQLSRDGRLVVALSAPETNKNDVRQFIEIRDVNTGERIGPDLMVSNLLTGWLLSPDSANFTTYGWPNAQVWDVAKGKPRWQPFVHLQSISSAAYDSNGRYLATCSEGLVRVWNCSTGLESFPGLKHPFLVSQAEFSPNGRLLVTCGQNDGFSKCPAQIWDVATGKLLLRLSHEDGILHASFSPDSRYVATAGEDFTARIWDCTTGAELIPPIRHDDQVTSVVFSPDGKWILTGSADKTARVWSAETGDPLTPAFRHFEAVLSARFSSDVRSILTVDNKRITRLWPLPVDERTLSELKSLAQMLSGGTVTPSGVIPSRQVTPSKILLDQHRSSHPTDFTTSDQSVAAWHDFQAQESELQGNWFAAVFHLKRMLLLRPGEQTFQTRLSAAENR